MESRSKFQLTFRWFRINGAFFLGSFLIIGMLCLLVPDLMLSIFGKWAVLLSSFGAKASGEFTSPSEMYVHILQRNALAVFVYFVIGFLLQAPIAMILGGAFYAFVAFLAPHTIGHAFELADWFLITVEIFALVISSSLSSGFGGELYQVSPTARDWWQYSKVSWRNLSMKAPVSWRILLPAWLHIILIGLLLVVGLIIFVAWFEVYGY